MKITIPVKECDIYQSFVFDCTIAFPKKKHFWERKKEISVSASASCNNKYVSGVSLCRANSGDSYKETVIVSGKNGDILQEKFDVKLTLNAKQLKEDKPDSAKIEICLLIDSKAIKELPEKLDFVYEEAKVEMRFDILNPRITYEKITGRYNFANLKIFNDTPDVPVDVNGTIEVETEDGAKVQNLITVDGENGNQFDATNLQTCQKTVNGTTASKTYKIYLNKAGIPRLTKGSTKFTIKVTGSRFYVLGNKNLSGDPDIQQRQFSITKDIRPSALSLQITNFDEKKSGVNIGDENNTSTYSFLPNDERMSRPVTLTLSNVAKEKITDGAGVMVSDVKVYEEGTTDRYLKNKQGQIINAVIKSKIKGLDGKNQVFLEDGSGQAVEISMQFDAQEITSTGNGKSEFDIKTRIVFQYWENIKGAPQNEYNANKKDGDVTVMWHLKMLPHEEWLCIDYGSSAIVCSYGTQGVQDDKAPLLKLRDRKQQLYKEDDVFRGRFAEADAEQGPYFLNSDIILYHRATNNGNPQSSLCSEQPLKANLSYNNEAVLLSPTPSLTKAHYQFLLPCMKILVGNTFLPGSVQYGEFQYCRKSANGEIENVKAKDVKDDDNCLLRVDTVLKESYHVLFRFFISPLISDINKVNKLALTYPNTYTPVHLRSLEAIAKSAFPNLLRFNPVAESDAVAAYYVKHWSDYHNSLDMDKGKEEYALVYDMGAGTLDLTYFTKKWDSATNAYDVRVTGKIGTGKAGNYLDYVIADIVVRLKKLDSGLTNLKVKGDASLHSLRIDLKRIVKDVIKPKLSEEDCEIEFEFNGSKYKITTSEIIKYPSFVKFIREITIDIIKKVANYLDKKKPKINTVIMSGRSCKLPIIKEKIKEAVTAIARDEGSGTTYVSLDTPVSLEGKNSLKSYDADLQKTVVVEGATILSCIDEQEEKSVRFTARRLYSSYGVFYKDHDSNKLRYAELINHDEMPYGEHGMIKSEPKTISTVAGNTRILLVQTYLSDKDTEACYTNGDREFISEMSEFSTAGYSNQQLKLSLEIDEDNAVTLYIGNSQAPGEPPKGYNLKSMVTRRSLWPLVFREN